MSTASERSFYLNETDQVWILHDGTVDLFVGLTRDGGARRHLHRLMPGDALFGLSRNSVDPAEPFVLAVPSPDAELHAMPAAHWQALLSQPALLENFADWIDGWIAGLCAGLSQSRPPRAAQALIPGQSLRLSAGTQVFAPGQVLWTEAAAGAAHWCDSPVTAPLFPVAPSRWLEMAATAPLRCVGPSTALEPRAAYSALADFHAHLLVALREALLRAQTLDGQRLAQRHEQDERIMQGALSGLAAVLRPDIAPTLFDSAQGNRAGLAAACARVLSACGVAPRIPDTLAEDAADAVAAIADASQVVSRRVALTERQWWTEDHTPLLAFWRDSGQPVALLPKPRGYVLFDPQSAREPQPVDAAVAARLDTNAVMFFLAFPDQNVGLRDLLRFSLTGSKADVRRVVLLGLVGSVLGIWVPFALGLLVDAIVPSGESSRLLQMALALGAVAFAAAAVEVVRSLSLLRIEARMGVATHAALIERLLRLPARFFRDYSAGDLAQRAFGIDGILQLFAGASQMAILQGVFSVASLVFLFLLSPLLALLASLVLLLAMAVTTAINLRRLRHERKMFDVEGRLAGLVFQLLSGIGKLRVAAAERRGFAVWARGFGEKKRLALKTQQLANHLLVVDAAYPLLALLGLFAYFANQNLRLSTGEFLAFNAAFAQLLTAAMGFSAALTSLLNAVPLYERARPILQAVPEASSIGVVRGELLGGIELARINFRYSADGPLVLQDVDLRIAPGAFVAVVGASGSGKSTLLRLLLGFEQPESGTIFYDGRDLTGLDVRMVRQQMGVVLQNGKLTPGDLFTNIVGASSLTLDDAWAAARDAGLEDDIRAMPMGMHTVIGEGGGALSGGQVQRLLIARALVTKPRIVLLDEATSALDNAAQDAVVTGLERISATRVVIAHRLSTIRKAHLIVVLDAGRVVESGSYDKLMQNNGRFAELARRQLADRSAD